MWVRFGGDDRVKPQEYSEYFADFATEERSKMARRWDARTGVILSRALRSGVAETLLWLWLGLVAGCAASGPRTPAPGPPPERPAAALTVAPGSPASNAEAESVASGPALASWHEGPSRLAIEAFVSKVSTRASPDYVAVRERIAVFDNDGTLWSEQPIYVQLAFTLDRIQELAPQHPEWKTLEPYKSAVERDVDAILSGGIDNWFKLVVATHAGMTSEEFSEIVRDWISSAQHPLYQRPYTELVYAPMLELLAYLRAHEFKTFIVSGAGLEFMRPWTEATYGIPPEQVVGSRVKTKWEKRADGPVLRRLQQVGFINDGPSKAVAIYESIGRHPIFAAGNSDGDLQMLEWTAARNGASLSLIVHHTDAAREVAYDRASRVGKLDKALDVATQSGWVIVDIERDWKRIFPFQPLPATDSDRSLGGAR